jgi:hypothetical protein
MSAGESLGDVLDELRIAALGRTARDGLEIVRDGGRVREPYLDPGSERLGKNLDVAAGALLRATESVEAPEEKSSVTRSIEIFAERLLDDRALGRIGSRAVHIQLLGQLGIDVWADQSSHSLFGLPALSVDHTGCAPRFGRPPSQRSVCAMRLPALKSLGAKHPRIPMVKIPRFPWPSTFEKAANAEAARRAAKQRERAPRARLINTLGSTDAEIREAVAMASLTRHWSMLLNGMLTDEAVFRREADQAIANLQRKMQAAAR